MVKVMLRSDDSPETWAPRLRKGWERFEGSTRDTVEAALALGRDLIEAKAALPHGQFGRLFADHEDAVAKPMPFNWKWANRLMAMARHPVISNSHHGGNLPADINALDMLARLSEEELSEAIETGKVTRSTTRREVRELIRPRTRDDNDHPDDRPPMTMADLAESPEAKAIVRKINTDIAKDSDPKDSESLRLLKFFWRNAGRSDRTKFLQWIKVQK